MVQPAMPTQLEKAQKTHDDAASAAREVREAADRAESEVRDREAELAALEAKHLLEAQAPPPEDDAEDDDDVASPAMMSPYPPLAEMVKRFRHDYGLGAEATTAEVVDEVCRDLSIAPTLPLVERAQRCYDVMYLGGVAPKGAAKGSRVVTVDKRMKADKRAIKAQEKRKKKFGSGKRGRK